MNTYEINKVSSNLYQIVRVDTGEVVSDYVNMSNAKRGLTRLLAREAKLSGGSSAPLTDSACADGRGAERTPPTSNTGGLLEGCRELADSSDYGSDYVSVVEPQYLMVNGKIKEIPLRRGVSTSAHIDTLTLTMRQDVFIEPNTLIDDDHPDNVINLAQRISSTLQTLMGFGIREQKNGINGYRYSFALGTDTANYGVIAFGGMRQRDSVMLYFYGDGLTAAIDGWENRLYNWLQVFAPYAKITRCDLAHDFLGGEYTPEQAKLDWINGGYTQQYTRPRAREHGYDWLDEAYPNNTPNVRSSDFIRTGKTLYIGTPRSSRMVRVYEKGRELGDSTSNWVRLELQMRNRDYIIPHDILIRAGEYLTGAYPVCEQLFAKYSHDASKADRVYKIQEISLDHIIRYASQAASPCINLLEQIGLDADGIVQLLKGGKSQLPKRFAWDQFDCASANQIYYHDQIEPIKLLSKKSDIFVLRYIRALYEADEKAKLQDYMDKMYRKAEQHYINHNIWGFDLF